MLHREIIREPSFLLPKQLKKWDLRDIIEITYLKKLSKLKSIFQKQNIQKS